ncbi:murein biosynthesis integral membrane protein MurJ [Pseudoalteromonas tunicata]|nr:murein biosynthesis integral membrane protein MurJ [Pseudoalteromonas tunicata]MDP5213019.1 murein biosynthesis integral membrane protein MurJ [Pseudoalteromonas tunicata]
MSKGLFRSGMIVSAMTMISRVLGLVRDSVVANLLGASAVADVFLFANRIPNFLRRLFAEGAFAQAFVPVLSEIKSQHGDDKVREFIAKASGTLGVILLIITILGVIGSPIIVAVFGTGWFMAWLDGEPAGEKFELAAMMLKLTFPYLFFISLVALSGAVLNVYNRFAVAAFTPVLLNICLIACALLLHDQFSSPGFALAVGVFLGGVVQLLFQIPFLYKARLLAKPKWAWQDENIKKVRTLMLPAIFGVSVSQINLLLDTVIASLLTTGSIAWLYYSDRLIEFPLGLFGIGIATVILPALSKLHVEQQGHRFQATLDWGVRFVIWLGLPALFGLIVISPIIITVLFGHGEFMAEGANNIEKVSYGVTAYALGLVSFMLIKVLAPGFYAQQNTKTPVKVGIIALVLNMVFNIMLAPFWGYVGLALATSLSATCNALLLFYFLSKQGVYHISRFSVIFSFKCLVSAGVMAGLVFYVERLCAWQQDTLSGQIIILSGLLILAAFSYFSMLLLLGIRPYMIKNVMGAES